MQDLNGWWLKVNSKEQLEEIKKCIINEKGRLNIFFKIAFEIVEKDLDRLEKLEKVIEILSDLIYFEGYIVSDYEIKPQTYCVRTYYGEITQEEYELMKEVLEDEK